MTWRGHAYSLLKLYYLEHHTNTACSCLLFQHSYTAMQCGLCQKQSTLQLATGMARHLPCPNENCTHYNSFQTCSWCWPSRSACSHCCCGRAAEPRSNWVLLQSTLDHRTTYGWETVATLRHLDVIRFDINEGLSKPHRLYYYHMVERRESFIAYNEVVISLIWMGIPGSIQQSSSSPQGQLSRPQTRDPSQSECKSQSPSPNLQRPLPSWLQHCSLPSFCHQTSFRGAHGRSAE